jgi:cyanate permease
VTRKAVKPKLNFKEAAQLFNNRTLWAFHPGQYCITALTYFSITWFPIYLIKGRGMTIMEAGWVAAMPAICGFSGGFSGGVTFGSQSNGQPGELA